MINTKKNTKMRGVFTQKKLKKHVLLAGLFSIAVLSLLFAFLLNNNEYLPLFGKAITPPSDKAFTIPLYAGNLPITNNLYITTIQSELSQKNVANGLIRGYISGEPAGNLNPLYRYKKISKNEYVYVTSKVSGYEEETLLGYIAKSAQQGAIQTVSLFENLQGSEQTWYYPSSSTAKNILNIPQQSIGKETILGYVASDDQTKITLPYSPEYVDSSVLQYVTSEGNRGSESEQSYKFPIISNDDGRTEIVLTLKAGPVPKLNQKIINAWEQHPTADLQTIEGLIQGEKTDWYILRMWGFEPASQGVHWKMIPSKLTEGFTGLNAGSSQRIYHANIISDEETNFTFTLQYGPEAKSLIPKGLLGYVVIETGPLLSSYLAGTPSIIKEYINNNTLDYDNTKLSPAPTLTILKGEGVSVGRISKTPRPMLIDVPFVKGEGKEQKTPFYSTGQSIQTTQSNILGYLSEQQQCIFTITNQTRCVGNTVQRQVYNLTCQNMWVDDTSCGTGYYCVTSGSASTCMPAQQCIDSDNGLSYTVKSNVTGPVSNSTKYIAQTFTDSCTNNGTSLVEYSCNAEGIVQQNNFGCSCTSGTCDAISCIDTDGGNNTLIKGNTTGPRDELHRYENVTFSDSCVNSTILKEYSCNNGRIIEERTVCACNEGLCIPFIQQTTRVLSLAVDIGITNGTITWTTSDTTNGFFVYHETGINTTITINTTMSATQHSYNLTGLKPETTYTGMLYYCNNQSTCNNSISVLFTTRKEYVQPTPQTILVNSTIINNIATFISNTTIHPETTYTGVLYYCSNQSTCNNSISVLFTMINESLYKLPQNVLLNSTILNNTSTFISNATINPETTYTGVLYYCINQSNCNNSIPVIFTTRNYYVHQVPQNVLLNSTILNNTSTFISNTTIHPETTYTGMLYYCTNLSTCNNSISVVFTMKKESVQQVPQTTLLNPTIINNTIIINNTTVFISNTTIIQQQSSSEFVQESPAPAPDETTINWSMIILLAIAGMAILTAIVIVLQPEKNDQTNTIKSKT